MIPYDIYIAYISWGNDGKRRPVIVLAAHKSTVSILKVTSQYYNKSEAVRARYVEIHDWLQAGLDKPSYIDTSLIINVPVIDIDPLPIGKLSEADKTRLAERLER